MGVVVELLQGLHEQGDVVFVEGRQRRVVQLADDGQRVLGVVLDAMPFPVDEGNSTRVRQFLEAAVAGPKVTERIG